jgi:hypothetical protein
MKRDFSRWLALLGDAAPLKSLTELRAWNEAHRSAGTLKYGQSNLDNADEIDLTTDRARYQADRRKDLLVTAKHGIDEVMKAKQLDALLFPAQNGNGIAARAGYPSVIVPFATGSEQRTAHISSGVQPETCALWRDVHRDGMQRAAFDRAGVRVRTSNQAANCAALVSMTNVTLTLRGS